MALNWDANPNSNTNPNFQHKDHNRQAAYANQLGCP